MTICLRFPGGTKPNSGLYCKSLFFILLFCCFCTSSIFAQVNLQITEIFSGQVGADLTADWFEITNTGTIAWVSGTDPNLYYDDDSAAAAEADLIQGITDIQPGESVIVIVTANAADVVIFSNIWTPVIDLNGVEIGSTNGAGLGAGGDQVNLWIGDPSASAPVHAGTYPNTANDDGKSWDVTLNAFSIVGNTSGAVATLALGGDNANVPNIGSPGNKGGTGVDPNAPELTGNAVLAAPYLNISTAGPSAVSADLGDPSDPLKTFGIPFIVADNNTPLANVLLTAASSNQSVVPDVNFVFSGTGANRKLDIVPMGVGYTTVTVTATDTEGKSDTYVINLAVSNATIHPNTTRFHYGSSDGSTAQPVDANYMWVADDENQTIRLFHRSQSGLPVYSKNFDADLGNTGEIDAEGSMRNGNRIFWIGSHTNLQRSIIFSTEQSGSGAAATLSYTGHYRTLLTDLITWDNANGHGLGAGFLGLAAGFELEGLSADPNHPDGALLAFRSPVIDGKALVVPVTNFQNMVTLNPVANSATFDTPLLMDLGGHSLRSMDCNANGCLLIAGPVGNVNDFRLYTWTGNTANAPELRAADLDLQTNGSSFEGIVALPAAPFSGNNGDTARVQLLVDTGTFDYYQDGTEAKDLPNPEWKKFRSEWVVLGPVTIPPAANPGDIVINEIMQNPLAVGDAVGEWFELYNNTTAEIDLNGWTIADKDNDSLVINNGGPLMIAAGGFLVLGVNADTLTNGGVQLDYVYDGNLFSLGNGDDELILIANDSTEIDRIDWDGGTLWPDPNGASMALSSVNFDNNNGVNWCTSVTPYGAGDKGTPGAANDCPPPPVADLQITEVWVGQDGTDLTADWFEITNFGQIALTPASGDLYYDDDSQDPVEADLINGITEIQPGESVIVVVDQQTAVTTFLNAWSPDYNLTGVQVGWTNGAGLGQGGDAVTLFVGVPAVSTLQDYESFPAIPSGLSYDVVLQGFSMPGTGMVQLGTNIAVATTATAGGTGLEPAIGSPGNQGPLVIPEFELHITEIYAGQVGTDLTADWFEIKNTGSGPWVSGVHGDLFYDDDSIDPVAADLIQGIPSIQPGATAIVLITPNASDVEVFRTIWSPVIDLSSVEIGWTDGAGLGQTGDLVALWAGDPSGNAPQDTASFPNTADYDGQSWDVELQAPSTVGNANGAVATLALGGTNVDVPNIGSPGDGLFIHQPSGLTITEIFSGQAGADLTADWFEITNTGSSTWIAGTDLALYYDDDSHNPTDASLIQGIDSIPAGASAIVLVTPNVADITTFTNVWSPVTDLSGVAIGWVDGPGLGAGGDAVTLWLGDPNLSLAIDTAFYPETAPFDGQSYDVELDSFSVVGNSNQAVVTLALGGDLMTVPNIGSPGNKGPISAVVDPYLNAEITVFPNPTNGLITLNSSFAGDIRELRVIDLNGRVWKTLEFASGIPQQADLSMLPAGVYGVQILAGKQMQTLKIVKQ